MSAAKNTCWTSILPSKQELKEPCKIVNLEMSLPVHFDHCTVSEREEPPKSLRAKSSLKPNLEDESRLSKLIDMFLVHITNINKKDCTYK